MSGPLLHTLHHLQELCKRAAASAHARAWVHNMDACLGQLLTIKVDAAVIVLVRVLHHVLYVLISDRLPSGPQDLTQLLDVNEPIRIPAGG